MYDYGLTFSPACQNNQRKCLLASGRVGCANRIEREYFKAKDSDTRNIPSKILAERIHLRGIARCADDDRIDHDDPPADPREFEEQSTERAVSG